jgi:hypothetical protein
MTIKKFDKSNLGAIRADIAAALSTVEKKHGMKLDLGNIRFSANDFRATLQANLGVTGAALDDPEFKWKKEYLELPEYLGMKKEWLGSEISLSGKKYIIVGASYKRVPKIILKDVQKGKYVNGTPDLVKGLIGK